MISKPKDGEVRLLNETDLDLTNRFNKTVVGWKTSSQGYNSLVNPMGFGLLRVIVRKKFDGEFEDLYDQPILVENAGAVIIAQLGEKIGFVQNFRFVGDRLSTEDVNYLKSMDSDHRLEELAGSLGQWRWELPAGIAPAESGDNLEEVVIKAAKLEASEEAGYKIEDVRIVGKVNFNPTFFAHPQFVVHGRISAQGDQNPEDYEMLGATKLFSPAEIRELINVGEFDDGRSLSALALAGIHIPN